MIGHTNRITDRQMDKVIKIYPPPTYEGGGWVKRSVPQKPEELVSHMLIPEGTCQEELDKGTVEVSLILESLNQLQ